MVSRDTTVHAAAVALAVVVLALVTQLGIDSGPPAIAATLLAYALVLGGAHFYLALRGEDGIVPVESRWRYLAMLAVLFAGVTLAALGGERTLGSLALDTLGAAVTVGALLVYFVAEGIAGYRATGADGEVS